MMSRFVCLALLLLCLGLGSAPATADDFRPAYLQLTERSATTYDVRWKTAARDEQTLLPVRPVFPDGSNMTVPLQSTYAGGTAVMIGRLEVPGSLSGKQLRFEGAEGGRTEILVRLIRMDGSEQLTRVTSADPQLTIEAQTTSLGVSVRYALLG